MPEPHSVNPETGCWEWQRGKISAGYGELKVNGVWAYAHRHYYEQAKGPIPVGLVIDHLCRNPGCVNPEHLEAVTNAENCRRGNKTILTADEVKQIRSAIGPYPEIAERFGISAPYVGTIKRGERWGDIESEVVTWKTHCKRGHPRVAGERTCGRCQRARIRRLYPGTPKSPEHRANMSAAAKRRWAKQKAAA